MSHDVSLNDYNLVLRHADKLMVRIAELEANLALAEADRDTNFARAKHAEARIAELEAGLDAVITESAACHVERDDALARLAAVIALCDGPRFVQIDCGAEYVPVNKVRAAATGDPT